MSDETAWVSTPSQPVVYTALKPISQEAAKTRLTSAEAFAGEPFGVGKVTVEFADGNGPVWCPDQAVWLDQQPRRALYPAFAVRYASTDEASKWQVRELTCYFLFQGNAPFRLGLVADEPYSASIEPTTDPKRREALLSTWWRHYKTRRKAFVEEYGEPQLVHTYLSSMLKRRLGLTDAPGAGSTVVATVMVMIFDGVLRRLAELLPGSRTPSRAGSQAPAGSRPDVLTKMFHGRVDRDFDRLLGLLFGTESIRIALQEDRMLSESETQEIADQPLPPEIATQSIALPYVPSGAQIEPIAGHVPEECFYLRCRSVADYFWLRNLVLAWGGSIDDLISMHALDYQIRPRLERQLGLPSSVEFRQALEPLISDMALIGCDIFFREGAAIGVLFEAADSRGLEALIRRQREATRRESTQAVEREIELGGRKAWLLSTPDNAIRSIYAVDGKYHLVTTSSYVARRFIEAGGGQRALGALREFRHARQKMPLSRNDAVFIYLSDPFFRKIVGPHYRIEMTRRMRASGDLQLVQMAWLAAQAEGAEARTLADLIRAGLLPPTFLDRPDASHPIVQDGLVFDSLRGAAGTFLPVPDVPLTKATRSEVDSYRRFASYYRTQWRRIDPVVVGVSHRPSRQTDREEVIVDVRITPYAREHYEQLFLRLDAPDRLKRVPVSGDLITIDARLKYLSSFWRSIPIRNARVYGGLRDFAPDYAVKDGKVETVSLSARSLLGDDYPIYVGVNTSGTVPTTNSLDGHTGPMDVEGYSESQRAFLPLLRWRRVWHDRWAAWAPRKDILQEVTPHLGLQQGERLAQIRFRMGDLASARGAPALQAICYMHARRISATNAQLMHQLIQQLGVQPDDARRTAESLLGARLVCPLGGDYHLQHHESGYPHWTGTAWPSESLYRETAVPDGYSFCFLDWLRGAEMELTLDRTTLSAHVELRVKRATHDDSNVKRVTLLKPITVSDLRIPKSGPALHEDKSKMESDYQQIQGTWEYVSARYGGEPLPEGRGVQLNFSGQTVTYTDKEGQAIEFKYRLHPQSNPKGLDTLRRDRETWNTKGIYALEGDRLTLCFSDDSEPRPRKFSTEKGDGRRLGVLKRVKSATAVTSTPTH